MGLSIGSVPEEGQIIRGEDGIGCLPEPLLCHILSFLTTEKAVWTSVLSSRWRSLWKWVPRLDLDNSSFPNDRACADFIEKFLCFQTESYLREFKLSIEKNTFYTDLSIYEPCLSIVIKRKIQHFQVDNHHPFWSVETEIPLTLSVCEALVSLNLHFVKLNDFVSLSLPCLKIIYLEDVIFPSDAAAETLISCSPVLEDLKISLSRYDIVVVLRVCSQSLKSFTLKQTGPVYAINGEHSVVIDTPRLEYLSLMEHQCKSFKIISMSDYVKVDLDVKFELMHNDLTDRNIIYNLLDKVSGVKDMTISWKTLKFIHNLQSLNPLPKFHALSCLRATMSLNISLEVLSIVLESCPNLKHLTLELVADYYPVAVITRSSTVLSPCLVSSLESVEIESPITEKATELKLCKYFLENSATLKKLVLRLKQSTAEKHEPGLLKQLFESPRRSSLCQFQVLPVVEKRPC